MKRLTKAERNYCGRYDMDCKSCEERYDGCDQDCENAALEGLGTIEDILGDIYDLSRLRELVEADREGRCVMLPAPFGTKMYIIANTRSRYGKKGKCVRPSKMTWYNAQDYTKNFGKTVFITREAAEKALEVAKT